jgi:hypothetical protein
VTLDQYWVSRAALSRSLSTTSLRTKVCAPVFLDYFFSLLQFAQEREKKLCFIP